jgi:predicted lipid-binding transport protein (Tim44 family)
MGVQEALMGLGIVVLLGALIFGAMRASKRRRSDQAAADVATRRNFNSEDRGPTG